MKTRTTYHNVTVEQALAQLPEREHAYAARVVDAALDLCGLGSADDDTPQGYQDERVRRYVHRVFEAGPDGVDELSGLQLMRLTPDQAVEPHQLALRLREQYLAWSRQVSQV